VRTDPLVGTGQLPKFSDTLFGIENSDLWLVPTAEVPITNMYRDEILDHAQLPIQHSAYTACFRREQFSAGREVRGIKRGYQFDKVEMVVFAREYESWEMLESLLQNALDVVRKLGLRYRVLRLASGDIGFSASMTYDIEIWSPGSGEWLEVSSVSNFTDFQARRAGLRYRSEDGSVKHLHTLNGSGLGIPRTFAAILEQNILPDGRVLIPTVLQPYLGNQEYLLPVKSV
jgi:seryl-tRNA synthetase